MKTNKFSITIKASKEKVWATLWNDETYRKWTSVFGPDSHAVSDWKEGSNIKFIDNNGCGINSTIITNTHFEQMSFQHIGELKDGIEITENWVDATENYYLQEVDGGTNLTITMDIKEEYEEYFTNTFPKAIALIKQISEDK